MIRCLLIASTSIAIHAANYERKLAAAVLVLEAGGESSNGMRAVWECYNNRLNESWRRFSSPVRRHGELWAINKASKHPKFNEALQIVSSLPQSNLTKGATHFEAIRNPTPYWAATMRATITIGNLRFYKKN